MKYLSVCSGIEAATVAWQPLGWSAVAYSEIEAFPSAVLAHHYPDTPNWGDMTQFKEWPDADVDVLVGGTPCQSFSVAGLRKGLDDPRGNLMLTYLAIAAKYRPQWLVWENVPGVLSSWSGADETGEMHPGQDEWEDTETSDFSCFLAGLEQLGYGWAYRSLDAQYFGLAQRRERVFVVGYSGDWHPAAAVLFERHSLQRHPAPRRKAGQIAPTIPARSTGGGGLGTDFDCDGGLIAAPHADISPALKARDHKGVSSDGDGDGTILVPMVAHTLRGDGFDASEDGTGRRTPLVVHATQDPCVLDTAFALGRNSGQENAVFSVRTANTSANGHGISEDLAHTLDQAQGQAIAFTQNQLDEVRQLEVAGAFAAEPGMKQQTFVAQQQVRRLTPVECERLQGFPDQYTRIPWGRKAAHDCPDGPRYKALGNSMAVPVMRWLGERIQMVTHLQTEVQL